MKAMLSIIPTLTSTSVLKGLTNSYKTGKSMEFSAYTNIDYAIADILDDFYKNSLGPVLKDHPV